MCKDINLDKKLEYKGYWYLPSSPNIKVAGTLTYYPNEKIILELIGSFDDDIFNNNEEHLIYGNTSDAKAITLVKCSKFPFLNFSAGFPIVRYRCDYLLIGKHIGGLDEKRQYSANIRIPELSYWCHPEALQTSLSFDKNSKQINQICISFHTKHENNKDIICNVQVNDNTSIILKKGIDYTDTSLTPQLEQYTYIKILKRNKSSIIDLLADIRTFEHFLSLATFDIVRSSDITIFDEETCLHENEQNGVIINFIHPFTERQNVYKNNRIHYYLFDYLSIKEFYPEMLRKWYNVPEDLYPIRLHLISSLKKQKLYSSVDFLVIIQAIEGFWWRFRDDSYHKKKSISKKEKTKLHTLLSELIAEFEDVELINKASINIEAVIDSRHYFSHFLPKCKKPKALDGMELFKESRKIRVLLICCILSFVGLQNHQIDTIFKKSNLELL